MDLALCTGVPVRIGVLGDGEGGLEIGALGFVLFCVVTNGVFFFSTRAR